MDLGDVSYDLGYKCNHIQTYTTNGIFNIDSNIQYHVAWYVSYLCFFIVILIALNGVKYDKKD